MLVQADQPLARFVIELRPIDHRRLIRIEGVEQHAAEHAFVPVAAGPHRAGRLLAPQPRGFIGRQVGFLNSGVYRQTFLDNLGLIVAVLVRKI